jgi:hypothetical protein
MNTLLIIAAIYYWCAWGVASYLLYRKEIKAMTRWTIGFRLCGLLLAVFGPLNFIMVGREIAKNICDFNSEAKW